jgi:hypothetical protein
VLGDGAREVRFESQSVARAAQVVTLDAEARLELHLLLHLRDEEEFAGSLAAFEVAVGPFGI